jgi:hypothetical protein
MIPETATFDFSKRFFSDCFILVQDSGSGPMGKAKPFLFGGLLGASTMFVAMQYHVIRSHDGFQLVPRTPQHSVGLAYADIRNWNVSQWTDRPELARALMAHGSTDLISQSVAENLADTVSTESATLDQLRSFLNKPVKALDIPDTGRSDAAESSTSTEAGSGRGSSGEQPFAIPFPRETKKASQLANSVRVTQGEEEDSVPDSTTRESRFSSEDIAEAESRDRSKSSTAASPLPRPGQQPQRKEAAARPSAPASSPFEEVTTDLESRARMALSRAQSTLNEPEVGASDSEPADDAADSGFSRSQIQQRLKSEIESAGFGDSVPRSSSSSRDSDVRAPERAGNDVDNSFDPFIE